MNSNQTNHALNLLERLSRVINNDASMSELKPAQWEALRFFSQANRFSSTPSGLTAYMGVTKGTISQTINALERKGLLRKIKGRGDRRAVKIQLTRQGQDILDKDPLQGLLSNMPDISSEALNLLSSTLEQLLTNAIERREGTPFGVCKTCQHFSHNEAQSEPHLCTLLQVPLSSHDSKLICLEHSEVSPKN